MLQQAMQQALLSITTILFCIYALLIIYYAVSWLSIKSVSTGNTNNPSVFITVIIPARNEEKNIGICLRSVLEQTYPSNLYEIIVVDDFSEDDTTAVVSSFKNNHLKLLQLKDVVASPINSYKKKAIEYAAQQASGELIVTTDADCTVTEHWLETIAAFYEKTRAAFIVMPVAINCSNRMIEIFQALDFMVLQGITGASVYKKFHSMCNGANLAYTKKAFETVNGFAGIDTIASGDDMLLMHKISKAFPDGVHYLKDRKVIVQTPAAGTVKEFLNQRIRWASKADKYEDKRITAVLLVVYLFNILMAALFVAGCISNEKIRISDFGFRILPAAIILLAVKTIIEFVFLFPVSKFFHKTLLLFWFPVMQPFHILYTIIAGFLGKFGTYSWKGRKVK